MTETQLHPAPVDASGETRWTGVGRSSDDDCFAAGAAAAADATLAPDPALYLVFAGHRRDHEALLAGVVSAAARHAVVVGCTTGGEIGGGVASDDDVVVMAIGGSGISVATRCAEIIGGDLHTAGEDAAGAVWDVADRNHTVLLLLSDALSGDQQEVVRGAYAAVGAGIPIVGGCAGDGLEMVTTSLFHADHTRTRIGSGHVIGVAISSVAPMGVGIHHGWTAAGEPVLVTHSVGTYVHTIDDEPALDRYLEFNGAPPELGDDPEAFARFAATHPIGVARRSGEGVCSIGSADPVSRSIVSFTHIPQGVVAYFMEGTEASVLEATTVACEKALGQLDGPAVGLIVFDCVARREVLGADDAAEVAELERAAGAPVAGFYTYGEFARTSGASGFHNGTLVVLAIG